MTDTTKNEDRQAPSETTRREWVVPAIRRMSAGSAENGGRAANDGGIFTS